ncbi:GTP-binding protein 8 [Bufo gargarizans]|uniref:GTP-binding protein 8 n=1 Tax=Bufo gargarizans TaxID=30331 RepID=UPI001CF1A8BE|nr:GTP-binding protein 8 [Bufo gargarizans]XP_044143373.1 GTP-binding protein 8 [Bufo gargarizans]XP_044143374.1 GTP-binding protein 8 [Bufo gargarizans]
MRTAFASGRLLRTYFPLWRLRRNAASLASMQEVMKLQEKKRSSIVFPVRDLEKLLSPDIDRTNFRLFDPTIEEITEAERWFRPSGKHVIDYFTSAVRMDHTPELQQPEVCFIGRSNVGKSSLIKSLFALVPGIEVKVSKTPGHTKKMNFFKVGKAFTLVDMPGYGYKAPEDFGDMVEAYIQERRSLKRTFLLVDGSIGIQKADLIAVEMCEELGIPYVIIMTKMDRSRPAVLVTQFMQIQDFIRSQTLGCFPEPFLVSALHFSGIHLLRCFIAHVTGNHPKVS